MRLQFQRCIIARVVPRTKFELLFMISELPQLLVGDGMAVATSVVLVRSAHPATTAHQGT